MLTELVAACYDLSEVSLESISPYAFEDRAIYRVRGRDGSSFVLRAFTGDVTVSLGRQVAVLDLLRQRRFPAPMVRLTNGGGALAHFQEWTALLVSYIDGSVANFTPGDVEALAGYLGCLHNLSPGIGKPGVVDIPLAPTHPRLAAERALAILNQALPKVPGSLHQFCEEAIAAIEYISEAGRSGRLPETIIHGDCWPANAVKQPDGRVVLVDWDRAGIGPAFLDLCYLLLTCHLGKPQLPAMEPEVALIAAVVRGYCRERRPSAAELSLLESGPLYDVALRLAQEVSLAASPDGLAENVWLQKLFARYRVCPQIAEIACEQFGKYREES